MINSKRLISAIIVLAMAGISIAQTSTNSPYTRYGFGELTDQGFGNNKAMGGISYGLRNGLQINASNPASYTAVDSLTFLFESGITLQNTNFKDGSIKTNAKNSTLDYIAMQFRLWKRMAMAAGFLPFSNVGYNMGQTHELEDVDNNGYWNESFSGSGGFHQVFVGLGYKVSNNLSVGANISYLYGDINYQSITTIGLASTSSVKQEEYSISDYKLDLGLQYTHKLNQKNVLNIGATYSLGHTLNGEAHKYHQTVASSIVQTQTGDTINNPFRLPHTFGIGFTYVHNNQLTIGVDYTLQKWENTHLDWNKFDQEEIQMSQRSKIAMGAEFIPNRYSHNYLKRIRYRAGAYYMTPYTKVSYRDENTGETNLYDGAREYGVSVGLGLPIGVPFSQSKSILNISGQYVKVTPKMKGLLEENYLKINIGVTFNERWFMKWKVN